jgi:hypothetical protein
MAISHGSCDGFDEMSGGLKAKRDRITDVQVPDALPARLNSLRLGHDVADGVGEAVDAPGHRDRL